ncbi:MAG: hypothetical protein WD889_03115 [Candidatus Colwellbacteria bacterium]
MSPVDITALNSPVEVRELTEEEASKLTSGPDVDLGSARVSGMLNSILGETRKSRGTKIFLLTWTGDKVPSGIELDGRVITWTQNGVVQSHGAWIGTYDRLVECGGEEGKEQQMLVFLYPPRLRDLYRGSA